MRVEDIELYRTYVVGSQPALRDGRYNLLRRAIPLAYGRYANARGQCGRIVVPRASDLGTRVFVVAVEEQRSWRSRGEDERSREWVVDTVTPRQIVATADEVAQRRRIEAEDAERHRQMMEKVQARRAEAAAKLVRSLGLPTEGVRLRMASISSVTRANLGLGDKVNHAPELTITPEALAAMVAGDHDAAELLAAWAAIEDPAC